MTSEIEEYMIQKVRAKRIEKADYLDVSHSFIGNVENFLITRQQL